ncbi:MAG: hypothetical protein M1422_01480 [Candidatus Thermoplasmatota archaeon]|nr:hypothetical protein [Candidatus Thermoplasmatota archaeon]MCL5254388.1 hypothetical protein [Candidatus Thermoplasmatota archaeon]
MRFRAETTPLLVVNVEDIRGFYNSGADYYMQKGGNPIALFAELRHYIILAVEWKRREEQLALANERMESIIRNNSDAFAFSTLTERLFLSTTNLRRSMAGSRKRSSGRGY